MEFSILGPLEVRHGGREVRVTGRKHRVLLASLLVHANETVPTYQLIDDLWEDDPPPSAANALQVYVSRLRKLLGPRPETNGGGEILSSRPGGYVLVVEPDELDATRFEALVDQGRRALQAGAFETARTKLDAALGLWRGPALGDLANERFAQPHVSRLGELRLLALETRIEADLALGRHDELTAELEAIVSQHPTRERFVGQLMLARYRCGRQADALTAFRDFRAIAVNDLGIQPTGELEALQGRILRQDPALDPTGTSSSPSRNNLPYISTTFVGRDYEKGELTRSVRDHSLTTITGPGGFGKTRLALEVARELQGDFDDGVWIAELDSISDERLVPHVVAQTIGVRDDPETPLHDSIVDHLGSSHTLIVCDNCEHVIDATARLLQLVLDGCPNVRLLATSREPLLISGERPWRIPPLLTPDPKKPMADEQIMQYDAVRLFAERAAPFIPQGGLTPDDAVVVAHICHGLEGIPHALELAAAQLPSLGLRRILDGLEDRLGFFTLSHDVPRRHQTLRAAIDWSYESLDATSRRVFDRVAVFAGSFTRDAAAAVCADLDREVDVGETLSDLARKSLLADEQTPRGPRWRMLETLRSYGRDRLRASNELDQAMRRHAMYFAELLERAEPELRGSDQKTWLQELDTDLANVRAALGWAIAVKDADTALRLAGSLWWFWGTSPDEGQQWLESALGVDGSVSSIGRARALLGAALIAWFQARLDEASELSVEGLAVARGAGDRLTEGLIVMMLATIAGDRGDHELADTLQRSAHDLFVELGDAWGIARSVYGRAIAARSVRDYRSALEFLDESRAMFSELRDETSLASCLLLMGDVALDVRNHVEAGKHFEGALKFARQVEDEETVAHALRGLGTAAYYDGDHERAGPLLQQALLLLMKLRARAHAVRCVEVIADLAVAIGAVEQATRLSAAVGAIRKTIDTVRFDAEELAHQQRLATVTTALDEVTFAREWSRGTAMSLEDAVALACEISTDQLSAETTS